MGGNALKEVSTRRYERAEYLLLEAEVLAKLREVFPLSRVEAVRAYRTKPSFGDMDVLVEVVPNDPLSGSMRRAQYEATLHPQQVVENGNVHSMDYKEFQVDLLFTPAESFEAARDYFAWNDLGNFVGRVAHKLGFKYGHEGLYVVLRDETYQWGEVLVTKDTRKTHEFLGFDHDRFLQGFDTLEDVFRFASNTKYFNKHMYDEENRAYRSKVRDRKRKVYQDFVTWMNEQPGLPEYPWESMKEQGGYEYKTEFLALAEQTFPDFAARLATARKEHDLVVQFKARWNGETVAALTGLADKELGHFMTFVKHRATPSKSDLPVFQQWALNLTPAGFEAFVQSEFEAFQRPRD